MENNHSIKSKILLICLIMGNVCFLPIFTSELSNNSLNYPFAAQIETNVVWNKTYGNIYAESYNDVKIGHDGYIYVCGEDTIDGFEVNGTIAKYDSAGNLIWFRSWGEIQPWVRCLALDLDSQGFIYVVVNYGLDESGYQILKYNSDGDLLWNSAFANSSLLIYDMMIQNDVIYLCGVNNSLSLFKQEIVVIARTLTGGLIWSKTFSDPHRDYYAKALFVKDNYVYSCGYSYQEDLDDADTILICYNTSGIFQWNRTWNLDNEYLQGIFVDDAIYCCGWTEKWDTTMQYDNYLLLKYDLNGNYATHKIWGSNGHERAHDIIINDEYIIVYGIGECIVGNQFDISISILEKSLNLINTNYWGDFAYIDWAARFSISNDGYIYAVGNTKTYSIDENHIYEDAVIIKFSDLKDLISNQDNKIFMIIGIFGGLVIVVMVLFIRKKRRNM